MIQQLDPKRLQEAEVFGKLADFIIHHLVSLAHAISETIIHLSQTNKYPNVSIKNAERAKRTESGEGHRVTVQ